MAKINKKSETTHRGLLELWEETKTIIDNIGYNKKYYALKFRVNTRRLIIVEYPPQADGGGMFIVVFNHQYAFKTYTQKAIPGK